MTLFTLRVEGTPGTFMVPFYPQEERFHFCSNHLSLSHLFSYTLLLFSIFLYSFALFSSSYSHCHWIKAKNKQAKKEQMRKEWELNKHIRWDDIRLHRQTEEKVVCVQPDVQVSSTFLYLSPQKVGENREEVRRLAVEHFNQGVSNPAWPTLSSIIDAYLSQADESLSYSSGLGILPPPWPVTLIYINHTLLFFTRWHQNTNTHPHATWRKKKFIDFWLTENGKKKDCAKPHIAAITWS